MPLPPPDTVWNAKYVACLAAVVDRLSPERLKKVTRPQRLSDVALWFDERKIDKYGAVNLSSVLRLLDKKTTTLAQRLHEGRVRIINDWVDEWLASGDKPRARLLAADPATIWTALRPTDLIDGDLVIDLDREMLGNALRCARQALLNDKCKVSVVEVDDEVAKTRDCRATTASSSSAASNATKDPEHPTASSPNPSTTFSTTSNATSTAFFTPSSNASSNARSTASSIGSPTTASTATPAKVIDKCQQGMSVKSRPVTSPLDYKENTTETPQPSAAGIKPKGTADGTLAVASLKISQKTPQAGPKGTVNETSSLSVPPVRTTASQRRERRKHLASIYLTRVVRKMTPASPTTSLSPAWRDGQQEQGGSLISGAAGWLDISALFEPFAAPAQRASAVPDATNSPRQQRRRSASTPPASPAGMARITRLAALEAL